MKRLLSTALCVLMLLPICCLRVYAVAQDEISAPSAELIDANSGKILFEKNKDEKRACASITKVMTLLLVMEALDDEKLHLDDVVTASAHAASMGGSDIWLEEGEQMTADDMIKATAVASANDAAVALAEHICGSEDDFVALMNQRAKDLGMKNTTFLNCNGLDEEGHLSSAYDVALMSQELLKHKKILDYTSIWLDTLRGGETQIVNTNKLLKSYQGITGLKTGTTSQAGSCITASAERDGLSLIAVVLGADSGTARFKDAAALLDYGFANFETVTVEENEALFPIAVEGGMQDQAELICDSRISLTVPKGSDANIKKKTDIAESLTAPVKKGQKVGTLTYSIGGEEIARFDILTAEEVEKKTFSAVMGEVLKALIKL